MKLTELSRTTAFRFALRYTADYLLILGVTLLAFHWTASRLIGDEVKRAVYLDARLQPKRPIPRPRHPREQAKVLFPSRDFH